MTKSLLNASSLFRHICISLLLCAACAGLGSCNGPATTSDEDLFVQQPSVCMVVGTKEYIGPSFGTLQISNNSQKHIYRAGIPVVMKDSQTGLDVEVVEEYYVLALEAIPGAEGSTVKGTLDLKSTQLRNGYQTYSDLEYTVKKISGNLVWLWAAKDHVGVVIQTL